MSFGFGGCSLSTMSTDNKRFPEDSFLSNFEYNSIEIENDDGSQTGKATIHFTQPSSSYEMLVYMKDGKKEGEGNILYANGTLFIRLTFVNDLAEGRVLKKDMNGRTILRGELKHGKECGLFEEYDSSRNVIWRGFYQNGKRYRSLNKKEGMNGFYSEMTVNNELLSVSEYDEKWMKNGKCFEVESGRLKRECVYEHGVKKRMIREFTGDGVACFGVNDNRGYGYSQYNSQCDMIEYDENGVRVYKGGYDGDILKGFTRGGSGTEYESDGKKAKYYGGWKNGKREGKGSEFKGLNLVYIGEWKNGMRDGIGEEYDENDEFVRSGRWIKDEYGIIRFGDGYESHNEVFSCSLLNGIERVQIGNDCFRGTNQIILDELNTLRCLFIGKNSFCLDGRREGSQLVIKNCSQLREIHIGENSFRWFDSFTLSNLPSLKSIQLDDYAFFFCLSVVFENLNTLESITLGKDSLQGNNYDRNNPSLKMKNLDSLTLLKGDGGCFVYVRKVIIEGIPVLTKNGIQLAGDNSFNNVRELTSTNAPDLEDFIQHRH